MVRHRPHFETWKRNEPFPLEARVQVLLTNNPWRQDSDGYFFFQNVLTRRPLPKTVQEVMERAKAFGFSAAQTNRHLRFVYARRNVEIWVSHDR
jgi:hypothetical protein